MKLEWCSCIYSIGESLQVYSVSIIEIIDELNTSHQPNSPGEVAVSAGNEAHNRTSFSGRVMVSINANHHQTLELH